MHTVQKQIYNTRVGGFPSAEHVSVNDVRSMVETSEWYVHTWRFVKKLFRLSAPYKPYQTLGLVPKMDNTRCPHKLRMLKKQSRYRPGVAQMVPGS